jgi:hypothetical protein
MNPRGQIERLIFLSSQTTVDKEIYITIAKQLDIPAQVGDCLAAVEILDPVCLGGNRRHDGDKEPAGAPIDRRNCEVNWATAFGLSLS